MDNDLSTGISNTHCQIGHIMSSKTEITDADPRLKILYKVAAWEHRKLPAYLKTRCPVEELQNAGYFGLVEAVSKYDPDNEKGLSFEAFAGWKIRAAIWTFLQSTRLIRLPKHIRVSLNKLNNVIESLFTKLNRYPTLEEISEEIAMPLEEIKKLILWATQIVYPDDDPEGSSEPPDMNLLPDKEIIGLVAFGRDLEDCLSTVISQKEIIILLLKEVVGLTLEEISRLLGEDVNISKAWRLNQHALKSLNDCLEQKGWPRLVE